MDNAAWAGDGEGGGGGGGDGGGVGCFSAAELLERLTCDSEAPSSSPTLTVSWICSR